MDACLVWYAKTDGPVLELRESIDLAKTCNARKTDRLVTETVRLFEVKKLRWRVVQAELKKTSKIHLADPSGPLALSFAWREGERGVFGCKRDETPTSKESRVAKSPGRKSRCQEREGMTAEDPTDTARVLVASGRSARLSVMISQALSWLFRLRQLECSMSNPKVWYDE